MAVRGCETNRSVSAVLAVRRAGRHGGSPGEDAAGTANLPQQR